MAGAELLELEAKAANTTAEKLIAAEAAKVPAPTAGEIQLIYDANREALGSRPLAEVKDEIVAFLRREPEQKAIDAYMLVLKTKYKYTPGKSINTPLLSPAGRSLGTLTEQLRPRCSAL
jgi:negative regulator of replication initiation